MRSKDYKRGVLDERQRVSEVIQNCLPDLKSLLKDLKADYTARGQWVLARLQELQDKKAPVSDPLIEADYASLEMRILARAGVGPEDFKKYMTGETSPKDLMEFFKETFPEAHAYFKEEPDEPTSV